MADSQRPRAAAASPIRNAKSRCLAVGQAEIDQLELHIGAWQKQEAACRAISEVPGIGRLKATALVATRGDAATFKSGREFAAFLGLVSRQSGTFGRVRLGSISKRGDRYLRTLLIDGARSVLCHTKVPTPWQSAIQVRRPANVAVAADQWDERPPSANGTEAPE